MATASWVGRRDVLTPTWPHSLCVVYGNRIRKLFRMWRLVSTLFVPNVNSIFSVLYVLLFYH